MNESANEHDPKPNPPEGASPVSGVPPPKDTRWKKGQSGNPGGRPKGRSVTAALRELAESDHNGKPIVVLLAERMMKEALSGKFTFAKEVVERLDGKVPDRHKIEPAGEQRIYVCPPPRVLGAGEAVKPAALPEPEEEAEGGGGE